MSAILEKQMKKEGELHAAEIKRAIDAALNSKQTKAAVEKAQKKSMWPPEPSKEVLKVLEATAEATWKKLKSKYSNNTAKITVQTGKNKPPSCTVTLEFKSQWRGGKKVMIQPGATLADMCEHIYGSPVYASEVIDANAKKLGMSINALPAGFELDFPRILVPEMHTKPKVSLPRAATKKAVRVAVPSMGSKYELKKTGEMAFVLGPVIVYVQLEGKGEVFCKKPKAFIDASYSLNAHEAEFKKGIGAIEGGFKVGLKGAQTTLEVKIVNITVGGLTFTKSLNLKEGSLDFKFASKDFKGVMINGMEYSGSVSLTAKVRIIPNPKFGVERRRVRRPVPVPAGKPELVFEYAENAIRTADVVIKVGAVIVVGAITIKLASVGSALLLAYLLANAAS